MRRNITAGQEHDFMPLTLQCSGTEPFWSIKTVQKGLVFSAPDTPDRALSLRKVMDRGIEGDPMRGMIAGDDKGRLTAVMQPQQCSDGMSDRAFALAVTVILDGQDQPSRMLTGCCSIAPFSSRSRATGWRWAPSVPNP